MMKPTKVCFRSNKQQEMVETYQCFGFDLDYQLPCGTVVMTYLEKQKEGFSVREEIYIVNGGLVVERDF